ncbi:glyoxylase-like metal-dependent hydrolase (beta-lactamase superfamily II) [Litorivivens lipolytica]|uniref:Glyoxylase-like metal-dependent hydrolase (Beta-lactamase superfamily II) n=1 Tax=Litorivivens lipolytica TaxID=1524264 RepID=A0A7W4W3Z7_9GAMM|nr:MBL fold metallo-hydrolase [Litorivivens lipolytica]MBB3047031.1 glyoxylase-like metal-dependent hydrolase (beta-lactamase superfamily II) [Litorivivens lipolytica]
MSDFTHGKAVELAPGVRRVVAPNPGVMTGPGTNSYLLGTKRVTVLDPGPAEAVHAEAILKAVKDGGGELVQIVTTHTHPDHSPCAALLKAETGATIIGAAIAQDGFQDESFAPDREPVHDELIDVDGMQLRAIYSPGHVGNHFCYLHEQSGLLFTGDHVMQGSTVVIIPPAGDMKDYIDSLERMLQYPLKHIAPGHGGLIDEPEKELDYLIKHRLKREAKVVEKLAGFEAVTVEELVVPVYDDVDPSLHPVAQLSLLAHLLKLEKDGRVSKNGDCWSFL